MSLYKPLLQTENKVRPVRMRMYKPLLQTENKVRPVRMRLYKPLLQTEKVPCPAVTGGLTSEQLLLLGCSVSHQTTASVTMLLTTLAWEVSQHAATTATSK